MWKNAFKPVSTNWSPIDATMSPMKRVTMACVLRPRRDPARMARSNTTNVTPAPITAAAMAVTGKPSGVWTAAKVTTAVIVPGPGGEHDERRKRVQCIRLVIRGRCLADRVTAAEHIESHIRNDQPADDPEHVQ